MTEETLRFVTVYDVSIAERPTVLRRIILGPGQIAKIETYRMQSSNEAVEKK